MPFGKSTLGGEFNVDPRKFTEDDRIKKAPEENVPHGRLIGAVTSIITIGVLIWFFWWIGTI